MSSLGFPGKPDGIDGGEVERYVRDGRIAEVSAYCETDVVSAYRVWLVRAFRGRLSRAEFEVSEDNLLGFLQERVGSKPHLVHALGRTHAKISAGTHFMRTPGRWKQPTSLTELRPAE